MKQQIKTYAILTFSVFLSAVGVYFFRFPNNFSFGGLTAIASVVSPFVPVSASTINFIFSVLLLAVGFRLLGKKFGIMTGYTSILFALFLFLFEWLIPLSGPLTDQPLMELCYGVALPAVGAAIQFNMGASGGGMDIVAALLKKYFDIETGKSLLYTDLVMVIASFFVFNVSTGLFSLLGLMARTLVVDSVIESINLAKYFNIICDKPEPICRYISDKLNHSATVYEAQGAFTHQRKYVILTALHPQQAVALRRYVKSVEPTAFVLITNTSEIIGRGFHSGT